MRAAPYVSTIRAALRRVQSEISAQTKPGSLYSRGLSREGWQGGYEQALMDVLLVLGGGGALPNTRTYWDGLRDPKNRRSP